MPLAAWQIGGEGPQRLTAGSVALEKDLESWIERDPRLLDAGLTVVNRQMSLGGVGKLDLLCVDPQGRATVVEIKRGALIRDTIAQALDYASAIATMPADDLKARVTAYMGADAATNSAVAALFDTSDGSPREVAVIVVGVGQDAAVERMIDYLGGAFGMPIRAVTFDVFTLGGAEVLVREETESEPIPATVSDAVPTNKREAVIARAGGPSSPNGRRMTLIAAAAERNGLYVRPYSRSLMVTPPQNKTRFLMNMWTWSAKPDELVISYGADAFAEFFPVEAARVAEIFGPDADAARIQTDEDAARWEGGLDRLFALINSGDLVDAEPEHESLAADPDTVVATKFDLDEWVVGALRELGGSASLVEISRVIWRDHESTLRSSGDLLYTWQYDVRWAAFRLRKRRRLKPATVSPRGVWELA